MDLKIGNPPPAVLAVMALLGALLALGAAVYIGVDLYRGLGDGAFLLVRGKPVSAADGFRYWFTLFGEGFSVVVMLGCTALMLKLYSLTRSMPENAPPADSSGDR